MNKQTSVFFLSLTLLASGYAFGQEAPIQEETSCLKNLAALTTKNFEQTKNAYAQCLKEEAVSFSQEQLTIPSDSILDTLIILDKNNASLVAAKISSSRSRSGSWFGSDSCSCSCSNEKINCNALKEAINNVRSAYYDLADKTFSETNADNVLPLTAPNLKTIKMHSKTKNTEDSPSIVDEITFINKNKEFFFSVLKKTVSPKEQTESNEPLYKCSYNIPESKCKRVFDFVQEDYDEQYPDKKA
jgi:hypothetical protein